MFRLLLLIGLFLYTSLYGFATPNNNKTVASPKTCLELKVGSGSESITEYIYIDNNSKEVLFVNDKTPAKVLVYDDEIIKFATSYPAPNDKGWTVEATYIINRYTGSCDVTYINKATSIGQKFDTTFFGIPNKHIYHYTGSARKVNITSQKF